MLFSVSKLLISLDNYHRRILYLTMFSTMFILIFLAYQTKHLHVLSVISLKQTNK